MNRKITAILFALTAAVFYAVNVPVSKILMQNIAPAFMAAFLYLGAGIGISITALLRPRNTITKSKHLTKNDLPYVIGMIVLDIAAPILLMFGIIYGTSSNASLLGNFEITATTLIAMLVFREAVSKRLWAALTLITISGMMLTFDGTESITFSYGSLLVLGAASCWGLENNCTRMIASKDTYEIVALKGIFSGIGSFVIALLAGEKLPELNYLLYAMLLGFVSYGLSIFFYVKAQNIIGAAKTSAYYAAAPFIGALLSFILLDENISGEYIAVLGVMMAGSGLAVMDTLIQSHTHEHIHVILHSHGEVRHKHIITHSHMHNHYSGTEKHRHFHRFTWQSSPEIPAHSEYSHLTFPPF